MINFKSYILLLVTIFSIILSGKLLAFETTAREAYLMDYNTGQALFEQHSTQKMVPSSMTKVLSVYLIFNALQQKTLNLDDEFIVSEDAWRTGGTKMFVPLQAKVKVEDLLRGIIVQSGNDACKVIAEGMYGDEATFAESMNELSKHLGLTQSNFMNSTGLPHPEHYSTAKDIAHIAQHIIRDFPQYYHYFSETEFTYNNIQQYNKNNLLGKQGVDGLKTGHTELGGYGVVISAIREGRRIIAVVNGLSSERERMQEAGKLLNYGFNHFINHKLLSAKAKIAELKVWNGAEDELPVHIEHDVEVTLAKSSKQIKPVIKVVYAAPLSAPIERGEIVAKLVIEHEGKEIYTKAISSDKDIAEANFFKRGKQNIKYYFNNIFSS